MSRSAVRPGSATSSSTRASQIPEGSSSARIPELDAKRFRRTDNGICLITQPMIDA
ncbi:MAG: hypothetical protein P0Y66_12885 [Candidatus Kaistia colombiensis]|nr:MAG: hypothetical protein P0Y66_12885 [Kaistia sp.]